MFIIIYDDLGRLSGQKIHNGPETISYAYDVGGNTTTVTSPSFSYSLAYDVVKLNLPCKIHKGSKEVVYVYGANGEKLAQQVNNTVTYYR